MFVNKGSFWLNDNDVSTMKKLSLFSCSRNETFSVSFIYRQILIKLQLKLCYLFSFFFKSYVCQFLKRPLLDTIQCRILRVGTLRPPNCQNKVKSYSFWRKNEQFVSLYNQLLGNSCNYLTFNWFQLNSMIRKPKNSMV